MSESKIQVKVGIVEFAGEGDPKWLSEQFDKILEKMPELLKIEISNPNDGNDGNLGNLGASQCTVAGGLSVLNIAGKLACKSGSDLVIAATAYMHFVEKKNTFSRDDITTTMQKATGFYKDTFRSNLTSTLARLEANGTMTKSGTLYALSAAKVGELNAVLSQ